LIISGTSLLFIPGYPPPSFRASDPYVDHFGKECFLYFSFQEVQINYFFPLRKEGIAANTVEEEREKLRQPGKTKPIHLVKRC